MRSRAIGLLGVLAAVAGLVVLGPAPVAAAAADRTWLALGDSYSAGTGILQELLLRSGDGRDCRRATGTRLDGSPTPARAWSASAYESVREEHGFGSLDFVACHGAITDDIEGQVAEASGGSDRTWDLVTLGVGGNDIGFADLIEDCIDLVPTWLTFQSPGCSVDLVDLKQWIAGLMGRPGAHPFRGTVPVPDLYDDVAKLVKPGGYVVVAGYPNLIEEPARWPAWQGSDAAGVQNCAGFPRDDIAMLREGLDILNAETKAAAEAAERRNTNGVQFVFLDVAGVYENASGRHGLCSADPWINGKVLGPEVLGAPLPRLVFDHSFHPARTGHDATGRALAAMFGSEIRFAAAVAPAVPGGLGVPVGPPIALPRQAWSPVGGSPIEDGSTPGSFRVSFFDLYWGGARSAPDVGCDHLLTGVARVVDGDGYGFAVRAGLGAGPDGGVADPTGQAFQYDPGAGGYRDTRYPDSEGGTVIPAATDTQWHRFSLAVLGDRYEVRIDDAVVGSGTTPLSCGELYLRLWRGTAEFRDLTVTPLGTAPGGAVG